jgi:hypothetical protein
MLLRVCDLRAQLSRRLGAPSSIARNMFAFCFTLMGDFKAARREFEAIGPIVTSSPWAMLGDPLAAFIKAHDLAS